MCDASYVRAPAPSREHPSEPVPVDRELLAARLVAMVAALTERAAELAKRGERP